MTNLNIALIHTDGDDDNKALAQIGAAAVLSWDKSSGPVRSELMKIACQVGGVQTVPDARERLERLIDRHRRD